MSLEINNRSSSLACFLCGSRDSSQFPRQNQDTWTKHLCKLFHIAESYDELELTEFNDTIKFAFYCAHCQSEIQSISDNYQIMEEIQEKLDVSQQQIEIRLRSCITALTINPVSDYCDDKDNPKRQQLLICMELSHIGDPDRRSPSKFGVSGSLVVSDHSSKVCDNSFDGDWEFEINENCEENDTDAEFLFEEKPDLDIEQNYNENVCVQLAPASQLQADGKNSLKSEIELTESNKDRKEQNFTSNKRRFLESEVHTTFAQSSIESNIDDTELIRRYKLKKLAINVERININKLSNKGNVDRKDLSSYKCLVSRCGKSYSTPSYLRCHHRNVHGPLIYHCEKCDKGFRVRAHFDRHTDGHTRQELLATATAQNLDSLKKFRCDDANCGKAFLTKTSLKKHKVAVRLQQEKKWSCEACGQCFATKCQLQSHEQSNHTRNFRFKCEEVGCQFGCVAGASLRRHMEIAHSVLDLRPFQCEECGNCYKFEDRLRVHMQTVHSPKTHICPICSKAFSHQNYLKIHAKVHSEVKANVCELCGFASRYRSNFVKHLKRIHGQGDANYTYVYKDKRKNRKRLRQPKKNNEIPNPSTTAGNGSEPTCTAEFT